MRKMSTYAAIMIILDSLLYNAKSVDLRHALSAELKKDVVICLLVSNKFAYLFTQSKKSLKLGLRSA